MLGEVQGQEATCLWLQHSRAAGVSESLHLLLLHEDVFGMGSPHKALGKAVA